MRYVPTRHLPTLMGLITALLFSLICAGQAFARPKPPALPTPAVICTTCGGGADGFFGSNQTWMNNATATWPQAAGNWCGIADIQAIEKYAYLKSTGSDATIPYPYQSNIAALLNSSAAISPWGQAHVDGTRTAGFKADIAADGGLDPRGAAWGAWDVTPNGYYFHNYIYSFSHTGNDPYGGNAATYAFGSDYGPAHGLNNPIIVAINQGEHLFLIDGVYATSDPSAGGETIDFVDTWDPSYGEAAHPYNNNYQEAWSIDDWLNIQITSNSGYLWKYPYSKTANQGYDPEPNTTPGYYDAPTGAVPNHWNGYYVTIEQDLVTRCQASPNIAYNQSGNEVAYNNGTQYCP